MGAHYYAADDLNRFEAMESQATIRIYVDGEMAYEGARWLRASNEFWVVAEVQFSGSGGRVTPSDRMTTIRP